MSADAADLPPGEPAPGISRELAGWRSAHYQDLRYELRLRLPPALDRVQGHLTLRFTFRAQPVDLVLDWRPSAIAALPPASASSLRVNGLAVPMPEARDDHLVISAAHFSAGENRVELEFESPVAPAGTAVTRYDDREDGSAYVYSLLVPADASSLFPCLDQPDLKARFTLEMTAPARLCRGRQCAPGRGANGCRRNALSLRGNRADQQLPFRVRSGAVRGAWAITAQPLGSSCASLARRVRCAN